jgi:predicted PurR-regulated permease PerM
MFVLLALFGFFALIYFISKSIKHIKKRLNKYNPEHERILNQFRETLDNTLEQILNEKW